MGKVLIRFDWAVKKLLRNKANFVVLEGFLSELLFDDIRIEKILESESNQDREGDKYNRVDILTQNSKNELVIIEIQNTYEIDYFHRMAYGASKALTENLDLGDTYSQIKKVISIHIVYFDLGQGSDYVYKGTTNFEGLHQKDTLELSTKQREAFLKDSVSSIFPEYYLIKVNKFNDIAQDTLDQWIYFLKNNEVKDEFKAKGLSEAKEVLDIMRLNKEQSYGYNRYLDYLHYKASEAFTLKIEQEEFMERKIQEEKQKAEEKVKEAEEKVKEAEEKVKEAEEKVKEAEEKAKEAEEKKQIEVAQNLIKLGFDNEVISKATGLNDEQINKLRI
jgi:predicted transposase/invertase (TIGR01784 family)